MELNVAFEFVGSVLMIYHLCYYYYYYYFVSVGWIVKVVFMNVKLKFITIYVNRKFL